MQKNVKVAKAKEKKAKDYLRNHPNKLLSSFADRIKGGWGPIGPNNPIGIHQQ
jgi:hypothetical protein